MGEHRDQIGARLGVDALVPQPHEIAEALAEHLLALLFAFNQPALVGHRGRNVRPVAQLASILEREVEQRRQHLRGEFDRNLVHPVEGFAARESVEHRADAASDQSFEIGEIVWRDDRLHHLALRLVPGRIHGDEHRQLEVPGPVAQGDAVERRKRPVVDLEGDDVLVLAHRPERPERTFLAIVDRRLPPQAAKIRLPDVLLIELGIADVDLVERHRLGQRRVIDSLRRVHDRCRHRHRRPPSKPWAGAPAATDARPTPNMDQTDRPRRSREGSGPV